MLWDSSGPAACAAGVQLQDCACSGSALIARLLNLLGIKQVAGIGHCLPASPLTEITRVRVPPLSRDDIPELTKALNALATAGMCFEALHFLPAQHNASAGNNLMR